MVRNARGKGHNDHATAKKGARRPLSSPARIGRGSHETSKVRCVEASRGRDPPITKHHMEKQRKAHHTMKHTQECPRARGMPMHNKV